MEVWMRWKISTALPSSPIFDFHVNFLASKFRPSSLVEVAGSLVGTVDADEAPPPTLFHSHPPIRSAFVRLFLNFKILIMILIIDASIKVEKCTELRTDNDKFVLN